MKLRKMRVVGLQEVFCSDGQAAGSGFDKKPSSQRFFVCPRKQISGVLALTLLCVLGCGGGKKSDAPAEQAAVPAATTAEPSAEKGASPGTTSAAPAQDSNRKYVDGIPYDVFFDRPLTVAAENQSPVLSGLGSEPAAAAPQMNTPMAAAPSSTPAAAPATAATAPAGETADWTEVLSSELLLAEIRRIRNALSSNLNSVGNYNREMLVIQADAAVLAAMAGVATQAEGTYTWKPNAKYVRDLAYVIANSAETRGRPAFEKAEKAYQNIVEILDGGTPTELPESGDETVFSDVAERNMLMKHVHANNEWLRTTISSEAELKSKKEEIVQRSTVLAAIGQVVSQEDYVFADEKEYQQYCQELIQGGLKMAKAAQEENFSDYRAGLDLFNTSCTNCHPKYLNN